MNNDGSGQIHQSNTLEPQMRWNEKLIKLDLFDGVDIIFTNPPFGSKIKIDDPEILQQYELAKIWEYDGENDSYSPKVPTKYQSSVPPEILFIERCVQLLKPGTGRMAMVVPDGILGTPGLSYVREWILKNTKILASIDLHPHTFEPGTSVQTSVLLLERRKKPIDSLDKNLDYEVFMALANHIGIDKRGNTLYVRDELGKEVVEYFEEKKTVVIEGDEVEIISKVGAKVVDDNTKQIAENFRKWLTGD